MTSNFIYNKQIERAMNKWGVSWFKFDEVSGNVTDSKGSAVGTITGANRVTGWNGEGNAINFNESQYVLFNDKVIPYQEFSIRFKIKVDTTSSSYMTVLDTGAYNAYNDSCMTIVIAKTGDALGRDGRLYVDLRKNKTSIISNYETNSSMFVCDNIWHDVLMSYTGGIVGSLCIYMDDIHTPVYKIDLTSSLATSFANNLLVGCGRGGYSDELRADFFNGQLDDLQIYNKALTPSDFRFNKTLILHNGEYKKWDVTNGWTTVSSTLPSSTLFLSDGMDSLPNQLDGLNDNFEVVTWTDETDSNRTLELNAIPSPQFIAKATVSNIKGTLSDIILNDSSTFTTYSNVRLLLTNDNSTWYKWNGANFENVTYSKVDDILALGNTYDELVNADYSRWTHSKINIGAFLKDDDTTTSKISELGFVTNSPIRTSQVSDLNFYILNTTAKIELDLKGLWLSGQLSDLDLTRVQYRVFLNEQPYYPISGQFTNLNNPPLNIDIVFKSDEVKMNDWNTLRVEFKDSFGTVDYWQTTFVGNYSSLMFMDTDGNYYSDDVGKILQYLDFGTFFGGQYSVEHEVVIKNKYGYDIENLTIEASTGHLPEGVEVQFSDTASPFTPQHNLLLPNELKNDEQVSFYIRMISDVDSIPNGENKFNIFVKAERKV